MLRTPPLRESTLTPAWLSRRAGLHVIVDSLAEDCAWGWDGAASGLRVVLHDQERMVFPEEVGLTAGPSEASLFGVRQVSISKLDGLYDQCQTTAHAHWKHNIFAQRYPIQYSARVSIWTIGRAILLDDIRGLVRIYIYRFFSPNPQCNFC